MPEIEEEVIGSHTEDSELHDNEQDNDTDSGDIYAMFGIEKPQGQQEKPEEDAPAIEQKPEPKTIKVKHNKEEIEVDVSDEKLPEYVQKSLALDKERERKAELERSLDRAAKLAGYQNHADFIANLDKIEQQQQQRQQDQFEQLRQELREQAEYNGLDPDKVEAWIQNHPDFVEAQRIKQQTAETLEQQRKDAIRQQNDAKWSSLYDAYPHLLDDARSWEQGETPTFYTQEMQDRINRGYDPIDAFELAHRSSIQQQTARKTEQRLIKEQQLGLRSKVETIPSPDREPSVPKALEDAFEAFGLGRATAKKYVK